MNRSFIIISVSAATLLAAASAEASAICKSYPENEWMSEDAIREKVAGMGYEIRKVQKEDGCWEIKGMKDGKRVEAYFDPVTAEVVLTK